MMNKSSIYDLINDYINETGLAFVRRDDEGWLGVMFKNEGEFIPFEDLGYSSELGFYRLSRFPDAKNESHLPEIEETFFSSGRFLEGEDNYEYLCIIDTAIADGGWVIGNWEHVEKLHHLLDRLLKTRTPDEEIDEFDERLGSRWLSVSEAAEEYGVSPATIRRVCEAGKIRNATKQRGSLWRFSENAFKAWFHREYQPQKGRRPGGVKGVPIPTHCWDCGALLTLPPDQRTYLGQCEPCAQGGAPHKARRN